MATKKADPIQARVEELAEKAYQCVSVEWHGALETYWDALPESQEGRVTVYESDRESFAIIVGLAYGIARGEDPFESSKSVLERASRAAAIAFERWGTWSLTFEQDRAARPMPLIYPDLDAHPEKPWEPVEDVANALETVANQLDGDERSMLADMSGRVENVALAVFSRQRAARTEKAVA